MRINKFLAHEGKGSRRDIDRMVEEGKVIINGRVAVLGDKVNEGDKVEVKFRGIQEKKQGNEFAAKRRNQADKRDR